MSRDPIHRSFHHHDDLRCFYAFSENYVLLISHDEVVHGKARCGHGCPEATTRGASSQPAGLPVGNTPASNCSWVQNSASGPNGRKSAGSTVQLDEDGYPVGPGFLTDLNASLP